MPYVIIIRPIGSRRYKYVQNVESSGVLWTNDPLDSYVWGSIESAEKFKKENKQFFDLDHKAVLKRSFSIQHCRFCYSEQPTMRRNAVECENGEDRIEFQCSYCNIKEEARYTLEGVKKT